MTTNNKKEYSTLKNDRDDRQPSTTTITDQSPTEQQQLVADATCDHSMIELSDQHILMHNVHDDESAPGTKSNNDHDDHHNNCNLNDLITEENPPLKISGTDDIPFTADGHREFIPQLHLSYEYYRNPLYHQLFSTTRPTAETSPGAYQCINNLTSRFFMRSDEQRRQQVVEQENTMLSHNPPPPSNQPSSSPQPVSSSSSSSTTTTTTTTTIYQYDPTQCADTDLERAHGWCDWATRAEIFVQLALALPLMISFMSTYALGLISLYYQSTFGPEALAATGVAIMFSHVFGSGILFGLNSGLDTLGSHSYGASKFTLIGTYTIKAALVSLSTSAALAILWWFSSHLLILLGIEPQIAQLAERYLRHMIPVLPPMVIFDLMRRFLEVQQITTPTMIVNVLGLLFIFPLNEIFLRYTNSGYLCTAWTITIINYIMCILLWVYLKWSKILHTSWPQRTLSLEMFRGLKLYLKYAIPSMCGTSLELLGFELQLLITSRLNSIPAMAAQNLLTTINYAIFSIPVCLGLAGSVRIGAFLGQCNTACALHSYKVALRLSLIFSTCISLGIFLLSDPIARTFAGEEHSQAVRDILQQAVPFLSVIHLFDGTQGMICQLARGAGKQRFAVVINFIGFWLIALPISYYFSLHLGSHKYGDDVQKKSGLGIAGQWLALLIGCTFVVVSYLIHFGTLSWTKWQHYIGHEVGDQMVGVVDEE